MGVKLDSLVEDFENTVSKNLSKTKEEALEKSAEVADVTTEVTEAEEATAEVIEEVTEETEVESGTIEVEADKADMETKAEEATEEVEKSLEPLEEAKEAKEEPVVEEESEKGLEEDKKDESSEATEEDKVEEAKEEPVEESTEKSFNDSVLGALEVVVKSYGQVSEESRGHGEKLTAIMETLVALTDRFTKLEGEMTAPESVAKSLLVDEVAKVAEPEEKAVGYVEKSATVAVADVAETTVEDSIEEAVQEADKELSGPNVKEINDKFVANVKKLSQESGSRPKVYEMRQLHNRVHSGSATEEDYIKFLAFAEND